MPLRLTAPCLPMQARPSNAEVPTAAAASTAAVPVAPAALLLTMGACA